MAEATLHYEDGVMTIPYTPSGADVAAGEVVPRTVGVGIASRDIPDGELGALNINGGVYTVTADAAIATGKNVWWNSTVNKVTETASTHKYFGVTVSAAAADGDAIDVAHVLAPISIDTT